MLPVFTAVSELPVPAFDTVLIKQSVLTRTEGPEQTVIEPAWPPATAVPPADTGVATVRLARFGAPFSVTLTVDDVALTQLVDTFRQIILTVPVYPASGTPAVEIVYVFVLVKPREAPVNEPVTVTSAVTEPGLVPQPV